MISVGSLDSFPFCPQSILLIKERPAMGGASESLNFCLKEEWEVWLKDE